ncbi:VOC family protein [Pelomonas sp. SE-A7]|uniref:bleomycin resistance protein n=1 Tax=Pelomonas sp. SE-A7 TaxID=3054953 RepID=UPI00259CD615|nr:VOC family protein [Pelomonas sp. SE-A7]MDM4766560.1 VOC family protein [Pelomonas sp. SE-A7]
MDAQQQAAVVFSGVTPILRVEDLEASLAYYQQSLGFTIDWRDGEGFASVSRGKVHLMLGVCDQGRSGTWVYVSINDADALHAELLARGVAVRHPPTNYPWGARELQLQDPDGHVLRFGSDATEEPYGPWCDGQGRLWHPQPDGSWTLKA